MLIVLRVLALGCVSAGVIYSLVPGGWPSRWVVLAICRWHILCVSTRRSSPPCGVCGGGWSPGLARCRTRQWIFAGNALWPGWISSASAHCGISRQACSRGRICGKEPLNTHLTTTALCLYMHASVSASVLSGSVIGAAAGGNVCFPSGSREAQAVFVVLVVQVVCAGFLNR